MSQPKLLLKRPLRQLKMQAQVLLISIRLILKQLPRWLQPYQLKLLLLPKSQQKLLLKQPLRQLLLQTKQAIKVLLMH
jgi:hypothetical protein